MAIRIIRRRSLTREELQHIEKFGALPSPLTRRRTLQLAGGLIGAGFLPTWGNPAAAQSAELAELLIRRLEIATKMIEVGTAVLTFIHVYNEKPTAEAKPVLLDTKNLRGISEGQAFHEVTVEPEQLLEFQAEAPPPASEGDKQCFCVTRLDSRFVDFTAFQR